MESRFSENKYIPELKQLWKLCFPLDAESFIDFYFEKVYKNDETLVYLENEKPIASFQMIPYPLKNNGQIKLAGYISGAMTHPDYRGKGIMSRMLEESFGVMQEKGYDYSFLIPQEEWLFDYYARFGYKKAFPSSFSAASFPRENVSNGIILRDTTIKISTRLEEVDLCDFFVTYSRFLMENDPVILKTQQQVAVLLEDLFIGKGILFSNDWGIAFLQEEEERVLIKEFFYFDSEIEDLFLSSISDYFHANNLIVQEYKTASASCRGMIKNLTDCTDVPTGIYMSMMLD